MLLAAGYAAFTYWPVVSPYVPFINQSRPAPAAAPQPASPEPKPVSSTEAAAAAAAAAAPTRESELADPFAIRIKVRKKVTEAAKPAEGQPGMEKPKPAALKLEGIWVDSGMKVAFISGQAVNRGGVVSGWKVTSISEDRVVLQKGSVQKTLKVEGIR